MPTHEIHPQDSSSAEKARTRSESPTRSLERARQDFVAAVHRETSGSDRERLVVVLDALIKWSTSRPTQVRFCTEELRAGVLAFASAQRGDVLWSATAVRGDAPYLSLLPRSSRRLPPEARARVVESLNQMTRTAMANDTHLRIGFGALKNETSRKAVLELIEELLPAAQA